MKSPQEIGLPDKFQKWYPGQEDIISEVQDMEQRFLGQIVPTGGGKTVCYMTSAALNPDRTLILTATKGLQDQLNQDFGPMITVVKGQSAYLCKVSPYSVQYGPCHWGYQCKFREKGCPYYDQLEKARQSKIVVTNYNFWFSNEPMTIGEFTLLVCDEAHDVDEILLDSQSVTLYEQDVSRFSAWPKEGQSMAYYVTWAGILKKLVDDEIEHTKKRGSIDGKEAAELLSISKKLAKLAKMRSRNYAVEHTGRSISFDMIWPVGIVEEFLLRGIPRVLFTSATLNKKVLEILGLREDSYILTEYQSQFSPYRRPITFLPTIKMDRNTTNAGMNLWLMTIDNIIRDRVDTKGIIHTVSYARANQLTASSRYRGSMLTHDSKALQSTVDRFKRMDPPAILVSPSIVTGYDFPDDECRWQIIGKIPFPDTRSKVAQARERIDPDYFMHKTMQALIQACGRGMRNSGDYCESFIIDSHWSWFRRKYKEFVPRWFQEAMRDVNTIPEVFDGES